MKYLKYIIAFILSFVFLYGLASIFSGIFRNFVPTDLPQPNLIPTGVPVIDYTIMAILAIFFMWWSAIELPRLGRYAGIVKVLIFSLIIILYVGIIGSRNF